DVTQPCHVPASCLMSVICFSAATAARGDTANTRATSSVIRPRELMRHPPLGNGSRAPRPAPRRGRNAPSTRPRRSERPAATPAHPAAGRAAREPAAGGADRGAVAPPGRENRLFGPAREGAELVCEARQRKIAAAHVPGRRRDPEALEVEDPALGDAERDRP